MSDLDHINGDLKPKTYFIITRWLGEKANLPDRLDLYGNVIHGGPNTVYFNCICEVLGEAYPQLLVRVYDINNSDNIKLLLSSNEFECRVISREFAKAAMKRPRAVKKNLEMYQ